MNSEMKKESLCRSEEKERLKCEKNLEQELVLPDYCADIKRILKCTVSTGIYSVSTTGRRVTVRGEALIRLVYADDKEKIDCCEKTVELSLGGEFRENYENSVVLVSASADYVNCRAVNPRKVTVNSGISVICSVMGTKSSEIICSMGEGIEECKRKCSEEVIICQGEKTFDMSETVVLDKDKPAVGKIIRQEAYVNVESQKAVENKLLVKGELVVKIIYCPSESENKTVKLVHKMPLSQIADIEGLTRECSIRTVCKVNQLKVVSRSDSSGAGRLLDVAAKISCFVCGTCVKEYEYIADCYSTSSENRCSFSQRDVLCCVYEGKKELRLVSAVPVSSIKEICDIWVSEKSVRLTPDRDRVGAVLSFNLCILGFDEKGIPVYKETETESETDIEIKNSCEELMCDFDCDITDVRWGAISQGSAEVTLLVNASVKVCSVEHISHVSKIEEIKDAPTVIRPALTVCYCSKNEKVWEIAKRYRTTVEALCRENGIEGETVDEAGMLMIPCV